MIRVLSFGNNISSFYITTHNIAAPVVEVTKPPYVPFISEVLSFGKHPCNWVLSSYIWVESSVYHPLTCHLKPSPAIPSPLSPSAMTCKLCLPDDMLQGGNRLVPCVTTWRRTT